MKPAGRNGKEVFFGMISVETSLTFRIAARHRHAIDPGWLSVVDDYHWEAPR
jgi:hypothetical protein